MSLRHEELGPKIKKIHQDNRSLYGVRKIWKQAKREGINVGRDQVASLMATQGLVGVVRGKRREQQFLMKQLPGQLTWESVTLLPKPLTAFGSRT